MIIPFMITISIIIIVVVNLHLVCHYCLLALFFYMSVLVVATSIVKTGMFVCICTVGRVVSVLLACCYCYDGY